MRMRWMWNPSIKPTRDDHKVYLVVDGFGHNGRIFRERDVEATVTDLMSEQYVAPARVVAVNRAEHRLEDASEDIAPEILRRADLAGYELPSSIQAFVDRHLGPDRQLTLRLARAAPHRDFYFVLASSRVTSRSPLQISTAKP
jgi:hypothetical protein